MIAAEQKARATYEHLINMTTNPEIIEPLYFLREREVVHYQRFGECLEILQRYPELNKSACRTNRRKGCGCRQ